MGKTRRVPIPAGTCLANPLCACADAAVNGVVALPEQLRGFFPGSEEKVLSSHTSSLATTIDRSIDVARALSR